MYIQLHLWRLILAGVAVFAATPALADVLADSAADFSSVQGAKGWYYGYFQAGNINSFQQLPHYDTQFTGWDQTATPPPWTLVGQYSVMQPNGTDSPPVQWAVREWVSTFSGPAVIAGKLYKADTNALSPGVFGSIYVNHVQVWTQFIAGTDGVGVSYSLPVTLQTGDVIDFALAPNGVAYSDSTVFSGTISSVYSLASVDFGVSQSVPSASGFLNALTATSPRPGDILPLQPKLWRVAASPYYYDAIRAFAPDIPIRLEVLDGFPPTNYGGYGPPWLDFAGWETWVRNLATPFQGNSTNVIFGVWNEPDDAWAFAPGQPGYQEFWSGTEEQFYETYWHAWNALVTVMGPAVQVAGPTFAGYTHAGMQAFLEYCLANGCQVNDLSWHELNDYDLTSMQRDTQDAITSFVQNPRYAPLQINRIDIDEIIGTTFWDQPGGVLRYFLAFEQSGANGAARSCGYDGTGADCEDGSLNGLLTVPDLLPTGAWWAHKVYADGVTSRVASTSTSSSTVAVLASNGVQGVQPPQILVGYADYLASAAGSSPSAQVQLSLAGAGPSTPSSSAAVVGVRVEYIPNNMRAALAQPEFVEDVTLPLNNGAGTMLLPPLLLGDAFRLTLLNTQSITFPAIADAAPGAAGFSLNATASSGLTVEFASNTGTVCTVTGTLVTLVSAGVCSIGASQSGNASFTAAAPVTQSFAVEASQTIAFGAVVNQPVNASPFALTAAATSGLTVAFISNTPAVCSVTGSTVTVAISGGCSITASQAGNGVFTAATPVTQRFTVFFNDVAPSDHYYAAINELAQHGITAGCGNNDYCPLEDITRDQMAIFIVRAIYGGDNFSYTATPYFTDVQTSTFGFKWIQKLKDLGITSGCTATTYCPGLVVTRDQMAVFIIRARLGLNLAGANPTFTYPVTPYFTDATAGNEFAFPWIQRMKKENITSGCTLTTYCSTQAVTRGDMAIFIMRGAFNQLLPAGTPMLTQISPSTLALEASGTYTITGVNTSFVQGTTALSPIPGVMTGAITVTSPTTMTVHLTAAANAGPQPYSILAITGAEEAVLSNGLVLQ